jgi:hypothetical protein
MNRDSSKEKFKIIDIYDEKGDANFEDILYSREFIEFLYQLITKYK